ncbi:hypothetical protein Salat_1043500 [Sesamum alatum]|uniref:Uncharacterized protein n=1 Tax=Sesamum alatum TaxID=300844 RepID=A0AAE2CSG2_9LAMI|nr:hypothetical protein Salat_1043500 [Sesamum alatum]
MKLEGVRIRGRKSTASSVDASAGCCCTLEEASAACEWVFELLNLGRGVKTVAALYGCCRRRRTHRKIVQTADRDVRNLNFCSLVLVRIRQPLLEQRNIYLEFCSITQLLAYFKVI